MSAQHCSASPLDQHLIGTLIADDVMLPASPVKFCIRACDAEPCAARPMDAS